MSTHAFPHRSIEKQNEHLSEYRRQKLYLFMRTVGCKVLSKRGEEALLTLLHLQGVNAPVNVAPSPIRCTILDSEQPVVIEQKELIQEEEKVQDEKESKIPCQKDLLTRRATSTTMFSLHLAHALSPKRKQNHLVVHRKSILGLVIPTYSVHENEQLSLV